MIILNMLNKIHKHFYYIFMGCINWKINKLIDKYILLLLIISFKLHLKLHKDMI